MLCLALAQHWTVSRLCSVARWQPETRTRASAAVILVLGYDQIRHSPGLPGCVRSESESLPQEEE